MLLIGSAVGGFLGLSATPALAATITVNSTADPGTGGCDVTECTLREAIAAANASSGISDTIDFNITGTGQHTIAVTGSQLPTIADPVIIDGFSDPDDAGRIEIDGSALAPGAQGLVLGTGSSGSTVKGLVINDFGEGIFVVDPSVVVEGNYLGTEPSGNVADANGTGIRVAGVGATIGGTTVAARNVISGNTTNGLSLQGSSAQVLGNYIGIGADGTTTVANGSHGIFIFSSDTNTIGGTTTTARNVISGNGSSGINISGTSTGNQVQGNYIGVNALGSTAKPNSSGVFIAGSAVGNTVGGSTTTAGACDGACNVIAGNSTGVYLASGTALSPNQVRGNFIGVHAGHAAQPNTFAGVVVDGGTGTVIGGSTANQRNVISGNGNGGGIYIQPSFAVSGLQIRGNYIGVNPAGSGALANAVDGILLNSVNAAISGANIQGNVVSGNGVNGIRVTGDETDGTTIAGNTIGLNAAGTAALANGSKGIAIDSGASQVVSDTTIGGSTPGDGNVISGNTGDGISLSGGGTTGVEIRRNSIHDNGGLGIDLADDDAVTPNDPMDVDTGANDGQNFPVLTGAVASGSQTLVTGTLNSNPSETFDIEVFTNSACDASGNGEGETYEATTQVTTNASGDGSFTATIPTALAGGSVVTATATDNDGNTSEFSACELVVESPEEPPPSTPPAVATCKGKAATIVGTSGDDVITGTPNRDVIAGLGGKDRIVGLKGNDLICAGAGGDKVSGSGGNDRIFGQGGKDNLRGSKGNDKLNGGGGSDRCHGGPGTDTARKCETVLQVP